VRLRVQFPNTEKERKEEEEMMEAADVSTYLASARP
jgi:hypothetical protein